MNPREFNGIKFDDLLKTYSSDTGVDEITGNELIHNMASMNGKEDTRKYNRSFK